MGYSVIQLLKGPKMQTKSYSVMAMDYSPCTMLFCSRSPIQPYTKSDLLTVNLFGAICFKNSVTGNV